MDYKERMDKAHEELNAIWRDNDSLTLPALAKVIGTSYPTLYHFMYKNRYIRLRTLLRIEKYLQDKKKEKIVEHDGSFKIGTITSGGWVSDGEKWIKNGVVDKRFEPIEIKKEQE